MGIRVKKSPSLCVNPRPCVNTPVLSEGPGLPCSSCCLALPFFPSSSLPLSLLLLAHPAPAQVHVPAWALGLL